MKLKLKDLRGIDPAVFTVITDFVEFDNKDVADPEDDREWLNDIYKLIVAIRGVDSDRSDYWSGILARVASDLVLNGRESAIETAIREGRAIGYLKRRVEDTTAGNGGPGDRRARTLERLGYLDG